jgi:hypothetical protein
MGMDAIDDGQMSEDAWLVLRSMHYSPERETLASIAIGPLVLGVGDTGVADGLRELEKHGYVTETAGRWRLTDACRTALDGVARRSEPRWPVSVPGAKRALKRLERRRP